MKRCAFCSYSSDDEAAFAAHAVSAHGWGATARVTAQPPPMPRGPIMYCYSCGSAQPSSAPTCGRCGGLLHLSEKAELFGRAYLLNNLDALVARALITEETADRIRAAVTPFVSGASPVPRVVAPTAQPTTRTEPVVQEPVPPREPPPPAIDVAGLFTPERAPSLLLYLGAFLIVVSALIFVSVSGRQISDALKLVLLLVGTLAFLAGGLVCHRVSRVLEAGRTFLVIGALLVPLDFVAYYALISHAQPLSSPAMWVIGSLVSASLYGIFAARAYGRAYSFLWFAAAISAVAGAGYLFELRLPWAYVAFAILALAIDIVDDRAPAVIRRITEPLDLVNRVFAAASFVLVAYVTPRFDADRWGLVAMLAIATAYYGSRSALEYAWERWLAIAGPGAIGLSIVYALHGAAQTYGFACALLAIGYAIAGDTAKVGTPIPVAAWIRERARALSYVGVLGALLPMSAYWRAPFVGAVVELGMAALLGTIAFIVATRKARSSKQRDLGGFVLVAALALHFGALYLLLTLGVITGGIAPFTQLEARDFALAFAPLATGLALAAAFAYRRAPALLPSVPFAALFSAAATVALTFRDAPLGTLTASAAALGVIVGAVMSRRSRGLWIAAAFAAVAAVCANTSLKPPAELPPVFIAAVALALFIPSFDVRVRRDDFARVTREIAVVAAGTAVVIGYLTIAQRGFRIDATQTSAWLATVPALLVLGGLGVTEALHRRSERGVIAFTIFFLAAALMIIARLGPSELEAYTVPMAAYLATVAWGIERFGSANLRASVLTLAEVAAAVMLIAPTYLVGSTSSSVTRPGDIPRSAAVLGEALVVLRIASLRGSNALGVTALSFMGLMVLRGAGAPLALEATTAIFGAIALVFALLVPRLIEWRMDPRLLELTELVGALLILAPPLARAAANRSDALEHGLSVLIAGVVIVLFGLLWARRVPVATALGALALVGLLALSDTRRSEPYVAAAGVALLLIALAIPRYLPPRLRVEYEWALEAVGVGLVLSGAIDRTFRVGDVHAARALAEALALITIGVASGRGGLSVASIGALAILSAWIFGDPRAREFHGIAAGAYLIALALVALRYARSRLDPRLLLALELGGVALFVLPTLLGGWSAEFFPQTIMVFAEILIVLGVGIAFHRRWLVAGALAAIGVETLRALIDVVNRLPNWALFGASGALLLTIGFVLLLRREAWNAWSRRALGWWTQL